MSKDGEVCYVPKAETGSSSLVAGVEPARLLARFTCAMSPPPGRHPDGGRAELNLQLENQRRVARLFARLINVGVKVFVTTHSDYIVKELNTGSC